MDEPSSSIYYSIITQLISEIATHGTSLNHRERVIITSLIAPDRRRNVIRDRYDLIVPTIYLRLRRMMNHLSRAGFCREPTCIVSLAGRIPVVASKDAKCFLTRHFDRKWSGRVTGFTSVGQRAVLFIVTIEPAALWFIDTSCELWSPGEAQTNRKTFISASPWPGLASEENRPRRGNKAWLMRALLSCRIDDREHATNGEEMLLKLPLLIRWANFSAAREKLLNPACLLDVENCACALAATFFSSLLSLDDEGAQRVSVARGCPFVQDAVRPRFDPSRHRVPAHGGVLLYRIKLPCRRIHLAFYELICLAATVTTFRKKKTNSIFVCEIYILHPLNQSKLTRASHTLNFHSSFVFFISYLFSFFNFSFSRISWSWKLPSYRKFWYEKSLVLWHSTLQRLRRKLRSLWLLHLRGSSEIWGERRENS